MMRAWSRVLLVFSAVMSAVAASVVAIAVNVLTERLPAWLDFVSGNPVWWVIGSTICAGLAGTGAWWTQHRYEKHLRDLVPMVQQPEAWVVSRPVEVAAIVRALTRRRAATVGVTTAVHGAGGFGKSTVARIVRADRRVLRRFGGRVYWVTVGRDARRGALVDKVNDLVRRIDSVRAQPFTDLGQAAEHLAAVLAAGPRRLVILDDVWFEDQLEAFPVAGQCARLVTTRDLSLIEGSRVRVDEMSAEQSRAVLTAGLPPLPSPTVDALLRATGRWPLLLRLVNKFLVDQWRLAGDTAGAANALLYLLARHGPRHMDVLTGTAVRELEMSDPGQRHQAVAATIEASTGLLTPEERARFAELAIFIEDEVVPVPLVEALWREAGGAAGLEAGALCIRLGELALLTVAADDYGGTVSLHDVVRDYLREELGDLRLSELHGVLLKSVAAVLPAAGDRTAWWELPESARYLWDHVIEHLIAAGRTAEADATVSDLRWTAARLVQSGPNGPFADLTRVGTDRATRLCLRFGQIAHLVAPTFPVHSAVDILLDRVAHDQDWGDQATGLIAQRTLPAVVHQGPLPDLPQPGLRRILADHEGTVHGVRISPDGTWLAAADSTGTVQLWDQVTGRQRAVLTGHARRVTAMVISPDSSWIATADGYGPVRIWDAATGRHRRALSGRARRATAVEITPDSGGVAAANGYGPVRIWDATTGRRLGTFGGPARATATRAADVVAAALTTIGVRLVGIGERLRWTTADRLRTGNRRWEILSQDHDKPFVYSRWRHSRVAVAVRFWVWKWRGNAAEPFADAARKCLRMVRVASQEVCGSTGDLLDEAGNWLADAHPLLKKVRHERSQRAWSDTGMADHREDLKAFAVAPDGSWRAAAEGPSVGIWNVDSSGPTDGARPGEYTIAGPGALSYDGTRLAVVDVVNNGVRIIDVATGRYSAVLRSRHIEPNAVAMSQTGSWLITAEDSEPLRIWTTGNGELRRALPSYTRGVRTVTISPTGDWFATTGTGGSVWIWETSTGRQTAEWRGHTTEVTSVVIASNGSRLAVAGGDGSVGVWDVTTSARIAVLPGRSGRIRAMAFFSDGSRVATAHDDRSVSIRNVSTGEQLLVLNVSVRAMAISPDDAWLATIGDDRAVRVWNPATGEVVAMTRVASDPETCIWSRCGQWIVLAGQGGIYRFTLDRAPAR